MEGWRSGKDFPNFQPSHRYLTNTVNKPLEVIGLTPTGEQATCLALWPGPKVVNLSWQHLYNPTIF
jgi:hypothetical protein